MATFSGLTLDKADTGYTLRVSGQRVCRDDQRHRRDACRGHPIGGDHAASSSVTTGSPFRLSVAAVDPFGNIDTNFGGSVDVALATDPDGAILGGTLTATARGGHGELSLT